MDEVNINITLKKVRVTLFSLQDKKSIGSLLISGINPIVPSVGDIAHYEQIEGIWLVKGRYFNAFKKQGNEDDTDEDFMLFVEDVMTSQSNEAFIAMKLLEAVTASVKAGQE